MQSFHLAYPTILRMRRARARTSIEFTFRGSYSFPATFYHFYHSFTTSSWLSLMEMEDAVRPSKEAIERMRTISQLVWSQHALTTSSELPLQCIQPQQMLGRVPAYLGRDFESRKDSLSLHHTSSLDGLSPLFISGKSIWQTTSEGECDLEQKVLPHQLLLGVQRSTTCVFADYSCFRHWPGVCNTLDNAEQGNYLAVLFYAWSYILSSTWLERQPSTLAQTRRMRYLHCRANESDIDDTQHCGGFEIDLCSMDDDAARWWAAVLSPAGWQATVFHNGHTYKSPWSVRNIDTRPFILRRNYDQHCPGSTPPSSRQALKYLADFCATHNLSGQCCAALMATLFIPFNSGRTITLPLPVPYTPAAVFTRPSSSKLNIAPLPFSRDKIYKQRELLPYYMTLSCNGWTLRSLLHSTFFNPDVYCNLVGSWLEPAFEALDPILDAEDHTRLTILLTRRQPVLGPLWLGAILTGTAMTILHAIQSGQWAVDLHAAAWTGTEQSFLTTKLSGPRAAKQSKINRDDECRLLFLTGCDGFSSVPVCPWKPFGSSALSDTEIAV
ncbi:conserved hypothetical protein [Coccidioides posadasii str. Silveira]|uniref:Uncharacterized protein n=2 Tax=Coccidioides posadasii (strain RMSCC 757 / Silveira) TaxID=443226 RepID=E9D4J7_COCPS|nr:conserved hypothetical protein [Coccidioides posadasii str. Silveira]